LKKLAKLFNNQRLIVHHEDFYSRCKLVHEQLLAGSRLTVPVLAPKAVQQLI
jgi:hypothetical protein